MPRIRLKDGNIELEVEGGTNEWTEKTFEKLRKMYLKFYNEKVKDKIFD